MSLTVFQYLTRELPKNTSFIALSKWDVAVTPDLKQGSAEGVAVMSITIYTKKSLRLADLESVGQLMVDQLIGGPTSPEAKSFEYRLVTTPFPAELLHNLD